MEQWKSIGAYLVIMNTHSYRNIKVTKIPLYRLFCLTLIFDIIVSHNLVFVFGLAYFTFVVCPAIVGIERKKYLFYELKIEICLFWMFCWQTNWLNANIVIKWEKQLLNIYSKNQIYSHWQMMQYVQKTLVCYWAFISILNTIWF